MQAVTDKARQITLVIFDIDGVLTDGGLILGEDGNEHKMFHVRDGHGLVMLREAGFHVAVITARTSNIVADRMASLGIEFVYQGQRDKGRAVSELMQKVGVKQEQTAYVGDDFIDLPAMRRSGLAIAVADAHPVVIEQAHWTTSARGGRGAVREVCELLLAAHGKLQPIIQNYLDA